MINYFINFINYFISDISYINNYIPQFMYNYNFILKLELSNLILHFKNLYFILAYLIFIIILNIYIYKLFYSIIYFLQFELISNLFQDFRQLKLFILYNKFENLFLNYYKELFKVNIKQFLVGTGIVLFFLLIYYFYFISLEIFSFTNYIHFKSIIYSPFVFSYLNNFFFQFEYIIIFKFLFFGYIFLHIFFGLYNIFYDYLKDIAFILFFISFIIYFFLFNIYLIYYNIEFYEIIFNSLLDFKK